MGDFAFQGFRKLIAMKLPLTITQIGSNAFSHSGLTMIEIPDKVTAIGEDAFAYCENLSSVIIGQGAKTFSKGAFYKSNVKDVYVKALTPPSVSSYLFTSNPTIHVYASALSKYQRSSWKDYGTIVGDLDDFIVDGIIPVPSYEGAEEGPFNDTIFDLSGRKVRNPQLKKGIYIIGNKKVVK